MVLRPGSRFLAIPFFVVSVTKDRRISGEARAQRRMEGLKAKSDLKSSSGVNLK